MWIFVGWGLNCCLDDISFSDLFLPLQVHTMMLETQVGLERDVDDGATTVIYYFPDTRTSTRTKLALKLTTFIF